MSITAATVKGGSCKKKEGSSQATMISIQNRSSLYRSPDKEFYCALAESARGAARGNLPAAGHSAGCHGVVASGQEVRKIRALAGNQLIIVTPGIRPAGTAGHEHKRSVTPKEALEAGADYLVVGRPIRDAPAPRAVAERILEETQAAFDSLRAAR